MTDPPKGTRVAAYYRCSTDGQEHSVEGQREVIRKEVEKRGWILVVEYQDEGESGATTGNRPGLQQLLGDAGTKKFDVAAMYDVSRVTRGGTGEFWVLEKQLEALLSTTAYLCDLRRAVSVNFYGWLMALLSNNN